MYADKVTDSMKAAMAETGRRRKAQRQYNRQHGITPRTISKPIPEEPATALDDTALRTKHDLAEELERLGGLMRKYSDEMDFENAAACRDRMRQIKSRLKRKERAGGGRAGRRAKAVAVPAARGGRGRR